MELKEFVTSDMDKDIITPNEVSAQVAELRQKIKRLHPENCPFCGGYHCIRVTSHGQPMPENMCCDDMMREVLRLEREVFGGD